MATFSLPDSFKEHPKYIPLLKKALLTVKPEGQKKFLYFKQYPFGAKKLPLVLVDFDPGCPAALAKAGYKPTDEGLVSLTAQDELNFESKKGNLKRIRIKKYFATMGGGIKPVYVPPGETDDDGEADLVTDAASSPPLQADNKLGELLKRIEELQAKSFPPKIEALKKQVLEKARSLGALNKYPEAMLLLDQLSAKAAAPTASGSTANAFRQQWAAARQSWRSANDNLDAQITELQGALRKSGDGELVEIAEFGLNGVTGNFKVPLMASMNEVDGANGEALTKAATKARAIIAGFRRHLQSDQKVEACDENPFNAKVSIRETLGEGLDKLDAALATAMA